MRVAIVDAFADAPFAGNPAGVVLLPGPAEDSWMQSVAAELRHSETAFVTDHDQAVQGLRWFTPVAEVDLCGHATLAAAHVLGGDRTFHTRSGALTCTSTGDGWVEMDFPADPPAPTEPWPELAGLVPDVTVTAVARGRFDLLVEVASAEQVRGLRPDLGALRLLPLRGLIVTAREDAGSAADIVSRCFYPAVGVDEDPVTGSAHCTLGSWWAPRLGVETFDACQASPRGGRIRVAVRGDRVALAGRAVTVVEGSLLG
jgi:predicted PhzF superfamily epimerase YddE/YHI9